MITILKLRRLDLFFTTETNHIVKLSKEEGAVGCQHWYRYWF